MNHILKCSSCQKYGMDDTCSCGGKCYKPKPPKYSPEDKYGSYRRKFLEEKETENDIVDNNN